MRPMDGTSLLCHAVGNEACGQVWRRWRGMVIRDGICMAQHVGFPGRDPKAPVCLGDPVPSRPR